MSNKDLLSKANDALSCAKSILLSEDVEDSFNMKCCVYCIHRAVELSLKGIIANCGVDYRKVGHNIHRAFFYVADLTDFALSEEVFDFLCDNVSVVGLWNLNNRYNMNYRVSKQILQDYVRFAELLYEDAVRFCAVDNSMQVIAIVFPLFS